MHLITHVGVILTNLVISEMFTPVTGSGSGLLSKRFKCWTK